MTNPTERDTVLGRLVLAPSVTGLICPLGIWARKTYLRGFGCAFARLALVLGLTCGFGGVASIRRSTSSKAGADCLRSVMAGV